MMLYQYIDKYGMHSRGMGEFSMDLFIGRTWPSKLINFWEFVLATLLNLLLLGAPFNNILANNFNKIYKTEISVPSCHCGGIITQIATSIMLPFIAPIQLKRRAGFQEKYFR